MPDNQPQDPNAQARTQVNINDADDVGYWTERFGVSEEELRKAVEQVGSSAEAVARHMEKNWLP
jgi:NACalpha-BTF3-like transcription factor